jgi:mycothiol synthase
VTLEIREPTLDDATALAEVINTHSRSLYGEADLSFDEVSHWFGLPDIWIRVTERGGELVAYLDVVTEKGTGGSRSHIDARPLDEEAAHAVVGAAEVYAREHAAPPAILRGYTSEPDRNAAGAYERTGFRIVRHSFEMRIDLANPQTPAWPEGVSVRSYTSADEDPVWHAMNEAFADSWDYQPPTAEGRAQWRHNTLENPRFDPELWFLAEDGDELAGISLCQWHLSGDPVFGWVQTLGVRRPWRRRGLALALLHYSFAEFQRRGATRVGLGVDAENPTGAVRLYERAGMHVERRNDTWEKRL